MRQVSIIILLIILAFISTNAVYCSTIKTGIKYSIPIDYSKLNEQELKLKAQDYFHNIQFVDDGVINDDMTNALMLYNILSKVNPENIDYPIRLGILLDKIGKDKQAKGNFGRAMALDKTNPFPYYCLGEFYHKRELYTKALKYYNKAYCLNFNTNYDLLYKMGDTYEKLGDTRSALKYLKEAFIQSPNLELEDKIKEVEAQDLVNREYYSDTRINIPKEKI